MHGNRAVVRLIRTLTVLATMSTLLFASIQPALAADAVLDTATGGSTETADGDNLLQFTSAGHVLGFSGGGVIVASANRMLEIEFLNAGTAAPEADAGGTDGASDNGAPPLSKIGYHNLWDGVTVVYEASEGAILKSTYYLSATEAGGLVDRIRLGYNRPVSIDENGNLVVAYENGTMVESAPIAWQEIEGERRPVAAAYALHGEREVGFSLGDYVPGIAVVIDPSLTWNTFLGTSVSDSCRAIAVDGSGNVYVGGYSYATWGSPVRPYTAGCFDAFAAKLDSSGSLVWNTFLGGSGTDIGSAITVDGSGNVYVGGESRVTWGTPLQAHQGNADAFAAKLDNDGHLTWNTFLGGSGIDHGRAIAVDGSGNVYVGGDSNATWGSSPVRAYTGDMDAFAARLDSNGVRLWNTFLGGSKNDEGYGIAVDGSGNVYVGGYSNTAWGSSPVRAYTGDMDAFAARLDSSGNLVWNTFLGSSGHDKCYAIAVDGSGNIYVGGYSSATWGSPVRAYTGSMDAFAAKLGSGGSLTWHTFLAGSEYDDGQAIAVDGSGNVYVGGYSNATWGSPLPAHAEGNDAFAARLDSSGSLVWNAFLGGSGDDRCYAIAVDGSGNVYVGGYSDATWGSPLQPHAGGWDAFAARLTPVPPPHAAFSATATRGTAPLVVRFADESTGGVLPYSYLWDFGDGATSVDENPTHTYEYAGRYAVTLTVTDSYDETDTAQAGITVQEAAPPPEPASFIASYFYIAPQVVVPNQDVQVSLNICNRGGERGSHSVTLCINGYQEQTHVVGVSPGSCQTVVFRVTRAAPGTYQVSVEGMQGQFTVLAPATAPRIITTTSSPGGLGTGGIIAIVVVAIALIAAILFLVRTTRRE